MSEVINVVKVSDSVSMSTLVWRKWFWPVGTQVFVASNVRFFLSDGTVVSVGGRTYRLQRVQIRGQLQNGAWPVIKAMAIPL